MSKRLREECLKLARAARVCAEFEKEEGRRYLEVPAEALLPANQSKKTAGQPDAPAAPDTVKTRESKLKEIAARVASCTRCELAQTRTHTVPGQGCACPEIMFIGEGPGEEEDRQGLAFVGRAGQLLTRIIEAMGYTRAEVFIGNVVKCRPPGNRTPYPHEMEACLPFLKEQIAILKPKVIVALGGTAVRGLLRTETGITKLRGQWMEFEGIPVMPTYHPAYLLRNEGGKKYVWADMQDVLQLLGRTPPPTAKRSR
jgi:uracil-DNA glycosylase family 4